MMRSWTSISGQDDREIPPWSNFFDHRRSLPISVTEIAHLGDRFQLLKHFSAEIIHHTALVRIVESAERPADPPLEG